MRSWGGRGLMVILMSVILSCAPAVDDATIQKM